MSFSAFSRALLVAALASVLAVSALAKPETLVRDEIPDQYKWDLTHIYPNWEAWEADMVTLREMMESYQQYRGRLAEGPEVILATSKLADDLGMLAYKLYTYPSLQYTQDTRQTEVQGRLQQVSILFSQFGAATAWFTPERLEIPEETMRAWIDSTPELEPYRFNILETYRLEAHTLDEKGEQILAYVSQFTSTPQNIYSMLSTADVKFPEVTLSDSSTVRATHANYEHSRSSYLNQADREAVFKAHMSTFNDFENTYASIYNGILQRDWFRAQARNYESTLHAALERNNIPTSVYDNLVQVAKQGSGPLQRYLTIRKKVLGLEHYQYFDSYLPLIDVDWQISFDEVRDPIVNSVAAFGKEYQATVARAFDERWLDVYENEGKRSGAFSMGVYGVHPYMLLNYTDTVYDAFVVAHEMGHTMHTVLSHENQPFNTASYEIFVAEVASTVNEAFFLDYLLEREKDPKRRIMLLQQEIDAISGTFYRQAMFADFELKAHRAVEAGHPITAQVLQGLYLETLNDFFGESLDNQEWYKNKWARIPHFYNSPYYVYQYATSKAASSLIFERMKKGSKKERQAAVDSYLELLKSGGSDNPVALMQKAGVDFTTTAPIEAMVARMDKLVTQLEKELIKTGALPKK